MSISAGQASQILCRNLFCPWANSNQVNEGLVSLIHTLPYLLAWPSDFPRNEKSGHKFAIGPSGLCSLDEHTIL